MKTCTKCGETKEFSEFSKNSRTRDGHYCWCKECKNQHYKETKTKPEVRLKGMIRGLRLLENKILFTEGKKSCSYCNKSYPLAEIVRNICPPCNLIRLRRYRTSEGGKIATKEWVDKNRDKINQTKKEWIVRNRDIVNQKQKEYREKKKLEKLQALEAQNDSSI